MGNTTMTPDFVTDSFKLFAEGFAKTAQANAKFFDESAKFWTDNAKNGVNTFRSEWEKMADEFTPMGKKNSDRIHKLFDEQVDRNVSFAKKAFETKPTMNPTEAFEQFTGMTRCGFDAARESMDAFVKFGSEMFQTWTDAGRRQVASTANMASATDNAKRPNQK